MSTCHYKHYDGRLLQGGVLRCTEHYISTTGHRGLCAVRSGEVAKDIWSQFTFPTLVKGQTYPLIQSTICFKTMIAIVFLAHATLRQTQSFCRYGTPAMGNLLVKNVHQLQLLSKASAQKSKS